MFCQGRKNVLSPDEKCSVTDSKMFCHPTQNVPSHAQKCSVTLPQGQTCLWKSGPFHRLFDRDGQGPTKLEFAIFSYLCYTESI